MKYRILGALAFLGLLILLPALLREAPAVAEKSSGSTDTVIIVTPHAESIKHEFERGFQRYYQRRFNRAITIDWRSPGGTADIVRYINDRYEAAFRRYCEERNLPWNAKIAAAFRNHRIKGDISGKSGEEARARAEFLQSDVSVDIDVFFGGGTYDHANQARKGYAVDAGIRQLHPQWFEPEIMPERWSGEDIFDPRGGYYGVCLATFGICYNPDRMKDLGAPPQRWRDLTASKYFNTLAVADPTKSGSINKCFEVIIQQCMAEAVADKKGVAQGWHDGFALIRRLVGNARSITESAGRVTREVASGNAAAGMAIDFYALSEAQFAAFQTQNKARRIEYVPPEGGSSVSADPVQLLRGAPNRQQAVAFIEFLLSEEGQQLWQYRAGTPGGPEKYTLRRPPVRRDLYSSKHQKFMADANYNPYTATGNFEYHGEWTGRYFNLIRVLIRTTMLDAADELQKAWRAIIAAGGESAVPEAAAMFDKAVVPYRKAAEAAAGLTVRADNPMSEVIKLRRSWTEHAIACYRQAAVLAAAGK
ncbi:MAG: ABC transporter substrate-binding protein [Lentisphaerae bacterium]|nr:ABC transporter substrate-binding protein [Lentisphaerota bacterium]